MKLRFLLLSLLALFGAARSAPAQSVFAVNFPAASTTSLSVDKTTGAIKGPVSAATFRTANGLGSGGGGAVDSVNSRTGAVTLTKADVGLSNADNTSDANKPVSTATQAALDLKTDKNPAQVDLAGGTTLAVGTEYVDTFTGNRTFTAITGTPVEGSRTSIEATVTATSVITFTPAVYRYGENGLASPIVWPVGTQFLQLKFSGGKWRLGDSGGPLNNLTATTAPVDGVDDAGDGYGVGSVWNNTTTKTVYQCADATVGASVWRKLSLIAGTDYVAPGGNIGAGTATTQSAGDNDTSIATTAFVQGELASSRSDTALAGSWNGVTGVAPTKNAVYHGIVAAVAPTFATEADGATITWTADALKAVQNSTVTLAGNRNLAMSGWVNGQTGVLIVKQDATGSRTLALPASSKVINGGSGAITLTTAANAIDILTVVYDGTNYFWTHGKNFN